jgi:hypothetical protein
MVSRFPVTFTTIEINSQQITILYIPFHFCKCNSPPLVHTLVSRVSLRNQLSVLHMLVHCRIIFLIILELTEVVLYTVTFVVQFVMSNTKTINAYTFL